MVFIWEQCMSRHPHTLDGMPLSQRSVVGKAIPNRDGAAGRAVSSGLWYRVVARDASIAATQLPLISDYFAEAIFVAGWPEGACLFMTGSCSSDMTDHRDETEPAIIFFSPAAIELVPHLIASCGAAPSLPPDRAGATLLVGKLSDWSLLPYSRH